MVSISEKAILPLPPQDRQDKNKQIFLPSDSVPGLHNIFLMHPYFFLFFAINPARLSIQNGAAGIIVSNHGARQLDYVPATIMALEEVQMLVLVKL